MQLCEQETDPAVLEAITGWTAFSCCAEAFLACKYWKQYDLSSMKQFAYQNRRVLYKNRLANPWFKCILWLGLKTWCRPQKPTNIKDKGN